MAIAKDVPNLVSDDPDFVVFDLLKIFRPNDHISGVSRIVREKCQGVKCSGVGIFFYNEGHIR